MNYSYGIAMNRLWISSAPVISIQHSLFFKLVYDCYKFLWVKSFMFFRFRRIII